MRRKKFPRTDWRIRLPFVLFSLILFSSCETAHYFMIETQKPAAITFPANMTEGTVVVNNTRDVDVTFTYNTRDLSSVILKKDTVLAIFHDFFASALDETGYFRNVLLYNVPLKEDSASLSSILSISSFLSEKIPSEKVMEITREAGVGSLLSIDRLSLDINETVHDIGYNNLFVDVTIKSNIKVSAYIPGEETSLASFILSDSITINQVVESNSNLILKYLPKQFLEQSAYNLSQKAATCFAPYWSSSERVLYAGMDSRMKLAYAYMQKEHRKEAADIWKKLYDSEKNNKKRGMIAINIALSEEMYDRHAEALTWVKKALDLYASEKPSKVANEIAFARHYQKELEERITQQVLLNRQLRVE
ncbi:MAG: tetratricopeptide repeat protein [Dysgonamonadaceae bacterium]|nr:tetratricopeptide repeat protein [Dysgonamonadaceae bacterium]